MTDLFLGPFASFRPFAASALGPRCLALLHQARQPFLIRQQTPIRQQRLARLCMTLGVRGRDHKLRRINRRKQSKPTFEHHRKYTQKQHSL